MASRWHRPSALAVALALYGALLLFSFHEADEDLWGRMAAGRLTVANGHVLEGDPFAYVPTKPRWVDHEWLSGVALYEVHRWLGGRGLLLLRAALGLSTIALTLGVARSTGGSPWSAAFLAVATWPLLAQGINGLLRAQAFTFALFALYLYALEKRPSRLLLLGLVPLTALWANLHGGFVVGPLLLLAYASGSLLERRRADAIGLTALGAACFLASLANPYGLAYWRYLLPALAMPRPEILEWKPLAIGLDHLHVELGVLLALVLAVQVRLRTGPTVVLGATLLASILHIRFAPFLALATIAFLPRALEAAVERGRTAFPKRLLWSLPPLAAMLFAEALFLLGLALSWYQRDFHLEMRVDPKRYPVAAIETLQRAPAGHLAVFFNWGEYALYHLYPAHLVSIDGRYETVYPDEVVQANWDFTRGVAGSEAFLDDPPADLALYPKDTGAAGYLETAVGWRLVQEDERFVLYQRLPKIRAGDGENRPSNSSYSIEAPKQGGNRVRTGNAANR